MHCKSCLIHCGDVQTYDFLKSVWPGEMGLHPPPFLKRTPTIVKAQARNYTQAICPSRHRLLNIADQPFFRDNKSKKRTVTPSAPFFTYPIAFTIRRLPHRIMAIPARLLTRQSLIGDYHESNSPPSPTTRQIPRAITSVQSLTYKTSFQ